jgi:outer membrane protein OmpA-like peptidoglycan-associated protein
LIFQEDRAMRRWVVASIFAGLLLGSGAAVAQDASLDASGVSKEELLMLFQKQKSRGLKLAPNTALAAPAAAQPAAAAEVATGAATETATAVGGTAAAPVTGVATAVTGTEVATATSVTVAQPVAAEVAAEVAAALPTVAEGAPVPVAYTELDKTEQINFRIGFDFDSAVLRVTEKEKLGALCAALTEIDGTFRIVGHTDAAGTDAYNEKLSLLRAEEVKRYLVGDCGIDAARLEAVGVGKRFLYNEEDPRSEENRRVEFQALS